MYYTSLLALILASVFNSISLVNLCNGHGFLVSPPPRSYTSLSARSSLINSYPCGNYAYSTEYPQISSIYSNFVHQNILSNSTQIITEGKNINISWIPIFYSSNSSYYQFYLCMDTTSYFYEKCVKLSSNKNETIFNLHFDSTIDNTLGYHKLSSITDKTIFNNELITNTLIIPNHIFHSLGITDTHTNEGNNISATLIFEWKISSYELLNNCADMIILPDSDDNENHDTLISFDELVSPILHNIPDSTETGSVCTYNPNGTQYKRLNTASVGQRCGANDHTCAAGQCCNVYGVCGPYMSHIYEYYYNDILLETIPIYSSLPNYGGIDVLNAQFSFCDSNIKIDNRYIPDEGWLMNEGYNASDFIDLCWKCNLDDPKDCDYDNWFQLNNTYAISQIYTFYNNDISSSSNSNNNGSLNTESKLSDLIVLIIFLIIFCLVFIWLYRVYKRSKHVGKATNMRLLESDTPHRARKISNSAIDVGGVSIHERDDIVGYDDDTDDDENSDTDSDNNHSIDNLNDSLTDEHQNGGSQNITSNNVGDILNNASLEASSGEKPLPKGWKEYTTESDERYYHNEITDTTTWDRPE